MKLQYISDSEGITTGVYIPISEWNALKDKYEGIEQDEVDNIPQWHKDIVSARLDEFPKGSGSETLDFEIIINTIEKSL